ncbi:MAG: TIGR01777 family protein [Streptosporangiales bacterium]|nr:TIGR01777 family protein [Streptosporangiales bacterium]
MKIAVTGSSGLVGSALVRALRADGHEVLRLVRRTAQAADEVTWDPAAGELRGEDLHGVQAAVNLAGAGIGDRRLTPAYRDKVLASRIGATTTLARTMAALRPRPSVLLSGSAVGWYGDPGNREVDETEPPGSGFIPDMVRQWEAATAPAEDAGIRVVHLRSGIVLSASGGALAKVLPLFRLGLGGRLGSGRQYMSWISLPDEVGAIGFLLTAGGVSGPVNLTTPHPVTNAVYTRAIGRVLGRPTLFAVPGFALRLALGGFAEEVLARRRVLPRRLLEAGYPFQHPDIDDALRAVIGGP